MNSWASASYIGVASLLSPWRHNLVLVGVLGVFAVICILASRPGFSPGWRTFPKGTGAVVDVLEKAGADWSVERAAEDGGWKPLDNPGGFLRGSPGSVLWVRARLANPGAVDMHGVVADSELYSDRVDFYERKPGGGWRQLRAGESVPASEKPLAGREAASR